MEPKRTTGDLLNLDIRHLHRKGFLSRASFFSWAWSRGGQPFATINLQYDPTGDTLTLRYRTRSGGEEWRDVERLVFLDRTPCTFGGTRPWFSCPGCGRRVAILYGGGVFQCRHCHRLAYSSQREGVLDSSTRPGDRLRAKLGWTPGVLNSREGKPKGMHWKTFEKLTRQYDETEARWIRALSAAPFMRRHGTDIPDLG
jgi:hypothetical protein